MKKKTFTEQHRISLRIAATYLCVGLLWTLVFDGLTPLSWNFGIHLLVENVFICFTAFLLYTVIQRYVRSVEASQRRIRESDLKYQSLIEHNSDAILTMNLQGEFTSANPKAVQLFGYTREEIMRLPCSILLNGVSQTNVLSVLQAYFEVHTDAYTCESRLLPKQGAPIDVDVKVVPIFIEHQVTGYFAIAEDITDKKRTECEIRMAKEQLMVDIAERIRVEEALRESEYKYRLIAEHTQSLIAVLNRDGCLQYASPSHETVLGYASSELENTYVKLRVHPDDVPLVQKAFAQSISRRKVHTCSFRLQHKEGTWVLLEGQFSPVVTAVGEVSTVIVVSQDITQRKQTEELLRKSERLSVVGQLAAGVAHEIRNPLTALKGFVQLLMDESKRNGTGKSVYFDIMSSELSRIETIVSEFLWIAKPQAVSYGMRNLESVLANVVALLESEALLNNVLICLDCCQGLPDIRCEENQLKQVFINILKNAIEAMPSGGRVWIQGRKFGEHHVRVRFLDEGTGMPAERVPRLGEPFYTTKEKGTGLGLTVSYKIIEEHHGTIDVRSEAGKGTMVDVILPLDFEDDQYDGVANRREIAAESVQISQ